MLDTQMPRNSQRDDEDFHKEPTIEQALIISQRKQLEQQAKEIKVLKEKCTRRKENQIDLREENKQQAKSIEVLVEALEGAADDYIRYVETKNLGCFKVGKYRAIANKFKTNKKDK